MGPARALVDAIAEGRTTAVAETEAAIARIEAGDGPINAVVVRDFDRARAQAADADIHRERGGEAPLLGLPMTVKESIDVAGLPTTWGLAEAAGHVADRDAVLVRRLRSAGAVILGKTNVPPALADHQASNPVYGVTRNPHGADRSPGGSSGGAAAAVAAGFVTAEVGSDIGGSIRIPASFCGVWGLKPTFDVIDRDGHFFPGTQPAGDPLSVVGPIASSADDLDLLLGVLARHPLAAPTRPDLDGVSVAAWIDHPDAPVSVEVRAAFEACLERLEAGGAMVDRRPDLPVGGDVQHEYLRMLGVAMSGGLPQPGQDPETVRWWFDRLDQQAATRRRWDDAFDERYDAVLAPVFSTTAFPIDDLDIAHRTLDVDGTAVAAVSQLVWASPPIYAGLPSVAFPAGIGADGLPIGLQLIGPRFADRTIVALAAHLAV
jgi:amidase